MDDPMRAATATPSRSRRAATWLLGMTMSASVMLGVGACWEFVDQTIPQIGREYQNAAMFRPWPGWTATYMVWHPLWVGVLLASAYLLTQRDTSRSVGTANSGCLNSAWRGARFGAMIFVVGCLPILMLIYASFQVSAAMVAISWGARCLLQYVCGGGAVAIVAWRFSPPDDQPPAST